jgi:hypothetical protein
MGVMLQLGQSFISYDVRQYRVGTYHSENTLDYCEAASQPTNRLGVTSFALQ